jgi:peptidoglycan LD-endopeptidase CwlK
MTVLKQVSILFFILHLLCMACMSIEKKIEINEVKEKKDSLSQDSLPAQMLRLIEAYPTQKMTGTVDTLVWEDGTKMPWTDSLESKNFQQLLNTPDLEDMFYTSYPKGELKSPPQRNLDPGRIRFEPFFKKMYGHTKKEVETKLTTIRFAGQALRVTTVNGIDKKLVAIAKEIEQYPEFKPYVQQVGGTFNWRKIAGTNRMSMHSFGATIDINVRYSNYWRWAVKDKDENGKRAIKYKNRIPYKLVDIFERHGFIWGGKWYHYDTMHFEYRPELL